MNTAYTTLLISIPGPVVNMSHSSSALEIFKSKNTFFYLEIFNCDKLNGSMEYYLFFFRRLRVEETGFFKYTRIQIGTFHFIRKKKRVGCFLNHVALEQQFVSLLEGLS